MKKITALIIMDGYGLSANEKGNAVGTHCSPYVRYLMENYPSTTLDASGMAVGLPDGQMGNSEVGHLNIGAGRVVYQELTRITKSIADGDFFENPELTSACDNVLKNNSQLHIMGLLSDGGVHSHNTHLYALLELAKRKGIQKVYVHCFMDGRDVSPTSGAGFMGELQQKISEIGVGHIATVSGRYYAMDRDNRWERVEKAYNALAKGEGNTATDPVAMLKESYKNDVTDEFIVPTVIVDSSNKPLTTIKSNDSVIFFNFRPDRAREITRVFTQSDFNAFDVKDRPQKLTWVCMTQYDATFTDVLVAYKPQSLTNTLGEYLAKCNRTQLRIAETEKYAHVTFFFNGGVEQPNENEARVLIASPKVATYDLQPEMSAVEVCDRAIAEINKEKYDVMILNFANCDMVGHTGVMSAAVKAVATVDDCVRRVVECVIQQGGRVFLTADHGNAEQMIAEDGSPFTAHTTNKVPFVLIDQQLKDKVTLKEGALCDIAPTMLYSMGLEIPFEMTGKVLIEKK